MVYKLIPGALYLYTDSAGSRATVTFIKFSLYHPLDVVVRKLDSDWDIRVPRSRISTLPSYRDLSDEEYRGARAIREYITKTPENHPTDEDKGVKEDLPASDNINHPSHYTSYKGIEVIQLTEQMNFNRGNAVKYIARAGLKSKDAELEDLKKAQWYIAREIERISN